MDRDMNILYILGVPLGYVMEWIYNLIPNYGWDIIIFTIVIRLLSIPLQLNQQKSMAKMSAFQPMIADIQIKYKDKPEKQQEEMLKLQQNYGYNPTAGCVPMLSSARRPSGVMTASTPRPSALLRSRATRPRRSRRLTTWERRGMVAFVIEASSFICSR